MTESFRFFKSGAVVAESSGADVADEAGRFLRARVAFGTEPGVAVPIEVYVDDVLKATMVFEAGIEGAQSFPLAGDYAEGSEIRVKPTVASGEDILVRLIGKSSS